MHNFWLTNFLDCINISMNQSYVLYLTKFVSFYFRHSWSDLVCGEMGRHLSHLILFLPASLREDLVSYCTHSLRSGSEINRRAWTGASADCQRSAISLVAWSQATVPTNILSGCHNNEALTRICVALIPFYSNWSHLLNVHILFLGAAEMLAMEMKASGMYVSRGLSFRQAEV